MLLGLVAARWPSGLLNGAGWLFVAGALMFGGTVSALALEGPRWLGAITPIGGILLITGWLLFAIAIARSGGAS